MNEGTTTESAGFLIPARTLSGSLEQMLEQLDEAIEALLAFRQRLVASSGHAAARSPKPSARPLR